MGRISGPEVVPLKHDLSRDEIEREPAVGGQKGDASGISRGQHGFGPPARYHQGRAEAWPMASASENFPSYRARPTMQPSIGSLASRPMCSRPPTPPEAITGARTCSARARVASRFGP